MNRSARVYRNKQFAGILSENGAGVYTFEYDQDYYNKQECSAISLTMPKNRRTYSCDYLFPFFFNMLAEGDNRRLQLRQFQISDDDDFGLLLATLHGDTVGAVSIQELVRDAE